MIQIVHGEHVHGIGLDPQTRCRHYSSELDIIAIKFKCCGHWFPCFECHETMTDHDTIVWPLKERNELAVLCGSCGYQLSISEYLDGGSHCPDCSSPFNPGCAKHYYLYFAL